MEDSNYLDSIDLPNIDDLLIEDDAPDLDERYLRKDITEDEKQTLMNAQDTHATMSKELNSSRYQIRSPEQQAAWTEKKTNNHIMMGCFVLRLRFVMEALLKECHSEHVTKIFGTFIKKSISKDKDAIKIEYHVKYNKKMASIIEAYLNGDSNAMDILSLTETLVKEHNLKYVKFIKPWCKRAIAMFDEAKAAQEAHAAQNDNGSCLELFDSTCYKVREMERLSGHSWSMIANIIRQIRILLASAEELRNRLVCTNLRSCIFSARSHYRSFGGNKIASFSDGDLIDEAALGLMHAADMYVHGNSARFTTYAEEWINLNVTRFAKKSNPVLLPIHATDLANKIIRSLRERETDGPLETLPKKEEIENEIGKVISDSIWKLAIMRYKGYGIATNCSTIGSESEDDTSSIDYFSRNEGHEEENELSIIANKIFGFIDEMTDASDEKIRITQLQRDFLVLRFREGYSNRELAEKYYGTTDAKYVRAELNKALEKLKMKLKKEDIHEFPLQ